MHHLPTPAISTLAATDSGAPTLDLLRSLYGTLTEQLDVVGCTPLPPGQPSRVSGLHARAWLLRLYALEMHAADAAVPAHRDSMLALLEALFAPVGAEGMEQVRVCS